MKMAKKIINSKYSDAFIIVALIYKTFIMSLYPKNPNRHPNSDLNRMRKFSSRLRYETVLQSTMLVKKDWFFNQKRKEFSSWTNFSQKLIS
jgi:hypothetical protein